MNDDDKKSEEIKRLRAALKEYADPDNYGTHHEHDRNALGVEYECDYITIDIGPEIAQAALCRGDMSERYYVDERVGCLAVRDKTKDDPDSSGHLDFDTHGVIKFWCG